MKPIVISPGRPRGRRIFGVLLLMSAGILLIGGCGGSLTISSAWTAAPPPIDGRRNTAWDPSMQKMPEHEMMFGILNDSDYLYISLITDDRGLQRQVFSGGLTIWFDAQGGNEKRFGLHYPIGSITGDGRSARPEDRRQAAAGGDDQDGTGEAGFLRPSFDSTEAEIFGPFPGEHKRISIASLTDLAVKIGFDGTTMIYEARVPFRDRGANPYAIGAGPGSEIGAGIETGGGFGGRGPGGKAFSPGMTPGGGGDRGGFGGGRRGGVRPPSGQRAEPLDVWARIRLAER